MCECIYTCIDSFLAITINSTYIYQVIHIFNKFINNLIIVLIIPFCAGMCLFIRYLLSYII